MWWDTVGWDRLTGSIRSQTQASPPSAAAIRDSRRDPGRVAECFEHVGQPFGGVVVEHAGGHGGAAGGQIDGQQRKRGGRHESSVPLVLTFVDVRLESSH